MYIKKLIFCSLLLFSFRSFAFSVSPNVSVSTTNEPIKEYMQTHFLKDFKEAIGFANSLNIIDSNDNFLLTIKIPEGIPQGVYRNNVLQVRVSSDPTESPLDRFKFSLFHELGHFINELAALENATFKEVFTLEQIARARLPRNAIQRDYNEQNRAFILSSNLYIANSAYSEFIADIFAASFLKTPGVKSLRDLSTMDTGIRGYTAQGAHDELNPIRGYVWKNYLSGNLSNPRELSAVVSKLFVACFQEVAQIFAEFKNDELNSIKIPTTEEKNFSLLERIIGLLQFKPEK